MNNPSAVIMKVQSFLPDRSSRQYKWAERRVKSITNRFFTICIGFFSLPLRKCYREMSSDICWLIFLSSYTLLKTCIGIHVVQSSPDIHCFDHLPMHLKDQIFITINAICYKMGIFIKDRLKISLAAISQQILPVCIIGLSATGKFHNRSSLR